MNNTRQVQQRLRNQYFVWLAAVLLVSLLAGCAFKVRLIAEYDAIIDNAVNALHVKTVSFFAKLNSSSRAEASYEANKEFYQEAQGDVAALILRAQVLEEGLQAHPLTTNFEALKAQYEDLAALHKTAPAAAVLNNAQDAFEQSFRAIVKHLLFLKWNQAQPALNQQ
ncbi:hypothetical protein [uncultured Thiodictyon sp.]|uniref:hypothetical protein n=1 Tax=uncultured Thiodictyon sp. TaxID=1846217 RepID=UPI0025F86FC8|nr:hypothetical protein [uncultured Thiodictyon sp.]